VSFTDVRALVEPHTPRKNVLDSTKNIIGYIKSGSLNTRLLGLCKDMFSTHEALLLHLSVRWLSKGNVLNRVFEMEDEIKLFSELKANEFLSCISDEIWVESLARLTKTFEEFNDLNLKP